MTDNEIIAAIRKASDWPARLDFRRDRRRKEAHILVFEHFEDTMELNRVYDTKVESVAHAIDRIREIVGPAMDDLVRWGYVSDHGRGQRNVRRLSLNRVRAPVAA